MQFLLLFSLNTLLALFHFDGWRGDIETPQAKQEALCTSVQLSAKVFLEGPYVFTPHATNPALSVGKMATSLSTSVPLAIPLTQPYTNAPFSFTYIKNGVAQSPGYINPDEATTNAVLTGNANTPDAIVDWVWLELWNKEEITPIAIPSTLIETHAALLQADGDIVDPSDGTSPVKITQNTGVPCEGRNFYIAIKHRNHLGVKATTFVNISSITPTSGNIADFTGATATFGVVLTTIGSLDPRKIITLSGSAAGANNGKALYSGDTDNSRAIDATDRANTWNNRTTPVISGYYKDDCSMGGTVEATDRAITWNNRFKTNL